MIDFLNTCVDNSWVIVKCMTTFFWGGGGILCMIHVGTVLKNVGLKMGIYFLFNK